MLIYLHTRKNDGSLSPMGNYDMDESEARKVIDDWKSYIQKKEPAVKTYEYRDRDPNTSKTTTRTVTIQFALIAHID
jgi:hypothetical protein